MASLTKEFGNLKIIQEKSETSLADFEKYFNGSCGSNIELLQALYWLEKHIQSLWEKANFGVIEVDKKMEQLIIRIYNKLPFDDSGVFWFGGLISSNDIPENCLSTIKTSFFNIALIVAASSQNNDFITVILTHLFYNVSSPTMFCEAFIENDTRLLSSLLAFLQIQKQNMALNFDYNFVDLFMALLLQFQGNMGSVFIDFLATETVMIPLIMRSFKFFDGQLMLLNDAHETLKLAAKSFHHEKTLFKRPENSISSMVFSIDGLQGSHQIAIAKREESSDTFAASKDNNLNISQFFNDFYMLVLDAHHQNRFPFRSDALVKCIKNFVQQNCVEICETKGAIK